MKVIKIAIVARSPAVPCLFLAQRQRQAAEDLRQAGLTLPATPSQSRSRSMIAHTSLPVSDYQRSKSFHIKTLQPLGYNYGKVKK